MRSLKMLLAGLIIHTGCASSPAPLEVTFPANTTLQLVSSQCSGGTSCPCHSDEGAESSSLVKVEPGYKRFEFQLPRSTSSIWVAIEGKGHYYKASEQIMPVCFSVDLPPGDHRITLHSENRDPEIGLQTGLLIKEYGPNAQPPWYRALDFICGGQGKCTQGGMENWVSFQRKIPKGMLDPCGSVVIRDLRFSGKRTDKQDPEYQDLTLNFVMKVYQFTTYRNPGSTECKAP